MKNKILLLSSALALSLASCGGSSSSSSSSASSILSSGQEASSSTDSASEGQHQSDSTATSPSEISQDDTDQSSPDDPLPHEGDIVVDFDAKIKNYPSPNITDEQFRALMVILLGDEDDADSAIESMQQDASSFNLRAMLNAMGFSYGELESLFGFIAKFNPASRSPDQTMEAYLDDLLDSLKDIMVFFEGDKFALTGMDSVSIPVGGRSSYRSTYEWGINGSIDSLIETATGKQKAQLEAIRDIYASDKQTTYLDLTSEQLVMVGRLLKGLLQAMLEENEDFVRYLLVATSMVNAQNADDQAYIRQLVDSYSIPSIVQNAGKVMLRLNITSSSYLKFVSAYMDLGLLSSEASIQGSTITQIDFFETLRSLFDELKATIDGKDLKTLFEFIYIGASEFSDELYEEIVSSENPGVVIASFYDGIYAKLTADQKQSLANLSNVAGIDYQEMVAELKNLPEQIQNNADINAYLLDLFAPVIEKYDPNGTLFSTGPLYYSYSGNIYFSLDEEIDPSYFLQHITAYGNAAIAGISSEEDIDTSSSGWKTSILHVDVMEGTTFKTYHVQVRYYVLPSVLLEDGPCFQTDNIKFLEKPSQYVIDNDTKERGVQFSYGRFDRATHKVTRQYKTIGYRYGDLNWAKGEHNLSLEGFNFHYYVYDLADSFYCIDAIENQENLGIYYVDSTILLSRNLTQTTLRMMIIRVVNVGEYGKYIVPDSYVNCTIEVNTQLLPGEQMTFDFPNGEQGTIYHLLDSDITRVYHTISVSYQRMPAYLEGSDEPIILAQEGETVLDAINYWVDGRAKIKYQDTEIGFNFSEPCGGQISGWNTNAGTDIREFTISCGSISRTCKYVMLPSDATLKEKLNGGFIMPRTSVEDMQFQSEMGYEVLDNGQSRFLVTNFGRVDGSIAASYLPELDTTTPGKHNVQSTNQGIATDVNYEVIDVSQIKITSTSKGTFTLSDHQAAYYATGDQYFVATYKGQTIDSWSLDSEDFANAPIGSGNHTITLTHVFGGTRLTYNVSYTVYDSLEMVVSSPSMQFVHASEDYIQVNMSIYLVLGDEKAFFGTMPNQIAIPENGHGYHKVTFNDMFNNLPRTGSIEYYIYDDNDVSKTYSEPTSSPFIVISQNDYYDWKVRFDSTLTTTINVGSYGSLTSYSNVSAFYSIPENDRSEGIHTAFVSFSGDTPIQATYEIAGITSKYVDVSLKNIQFTNGQNICSIDDVENFDIDSCYLSISYNAGNYFDGGDFRYVDGQSLQISWDKTHVTNGYAYGYIQYMGMVFSFQYIIYDPSSITDTIEEVSINSKRFFVLGELCEGDLIEVYGERRTYAIVDGVRVFLRSEWFNETITMNDSDVTEGEHTKALPGGAQFNYAVYELNDSHVHIQGASLDMSGSLGYRIGEEFRGNVFVSGYVEAFGTNLYFYTPLSATEDNVSGFDTSTSSEGQWRYACPNVEVENEKDPYSMRVRYFVYDESEIQRIDNGELVFILQGDENTEREVYYDYQEFVVNPDGDNEYINGASGWTNITIDTSKSGTFAIETYDGDRLITIIVHVVSLDECELVYQIGDYILEGEPYEIQFAQNDTVWFYLAYLTDDGTYFDFGSTEIDISSYVSFTLNTDGFGEMRQHEAIGGNEITFLYYVNPYHFSYYAADGQRQGQIHEGDEITVAAGGFITLSGTSDIGTFHFYVDGNEVDSENGESIRIRPALGDIDRIYEVTISNPEYPNRSISFTIKVEGVFDEPYVLDLIPNGQNYWEVGEGYYISHATDDDAATMSFGFFKDGTFSFSYDVSSEENYDQLIIVIFDSENSPIDSYQISGDDVGSLSFDVSAGMVITIAYSKDGSVGSGRDNAIISDITFLES